MEFGRKKYFIILSILLCIGVFCSGCDTRNAEEVRNEFQTKYFAASSSAGETVDTTETVVDAEEDSDADAIVGAEVEFEDEDSGEYEADNLGQSNETWSVFLYLCGTDLESNGYNATDNLVEVVSSIYSDKINFVVQTGGTKDWHIGEGLGLEVDSSKLQRWIRTENTFELVDEQPGASMGDAATLGDFLSWGVANYPADKSMVIFWDHGGGSGTGVIFDELYEGDFLRLDEVSEGLKQANTRFEVIGFDACLMSSIETAAAVAPYGRYMVASEETEPGPGWDYESWLSYLSEDTSMDGSLLGIEICDSFYNKCDYFGQGSMATLAVTDLNKIPALVKAFNEMASEIKGYTDDITVMKPLSQAILKAENYGGNNENEGYANMVDLGDLTMCAQGIISETGERVLDCIIDAVPYHVSGEARANSNGISVYMPLGVVDEELDLYARNSAVSAEYLRFIEGVVDWKAPDDAVVSIPAFDGDTGEMSVEEIEIGSAEASEGLNPEDYKVDFVMGIDEGGFITLTMKKGADILTEAKCNMYYYAEDYNEILYLGSDYNVNFNDDWTEFKDNFANTWIFMENQLCPVIAVESNEKNMIYTVPVLVNGERTNIRLLFDCNTLTFKVAGIWGGINEETGYSDRISNKLEDGDEVQFVYAAYNPQTGESYEYTDGGFTVNGDIKVIDDELWDGVYYYSFELTDIFGRTYESDMAYITVENGKITTSMEGLSDN